MRRIQQDWTNKYADPIHMVDFCGMQSLQQCLLQSCQLGLTSGRGKYNRTKKQLTSVKAITATPCPAITARGSVMDRQEAERIYEAGRVAVIAALLTMDARIKEMEQVIARLTINSSNSSRPPSSDPPGLKKKAQNQQKAG